VLDAFLGARESCAFGVVTCPRYLRGFSRWRSLWPPAWAVLLHLFLALAVFVIEHGSEDDPWATCGLDRYVLV
jgi:hypothetical protein